MDRNKLINQLGTPVFYAVATAVSFFVMFVSLATWDTLISRNFGYLFGLNGVIEAGILAAAVGLGVFWNANRFMYALENRPHASYLIHFRQTSLLYVMLVYYGSFFVKQGGLYGGLAESVRLIFIAMVVFGISVNAVFMWGRVK